MAQIPVSPRSQTYIAVNSTGPFPIEFPLFDGTGADLYVMLDDAEATGWTFSGTLESGFYGEPNTWVNGSISFAEPISGTLVIDGRRLPRRQDQFGEGRGIPARDQNTSLNVLTAVDQELRRDGDRIKISAVQVKSGQAPTLDVDASKGKLIGIDGGGLFVPVAPNLLPNAIVAESIIDSTAVGRTLLTAESYMQAAALLPTTIVFDTLAAARSATIAPTIDGIVLFGYAELGDGGGFAPYKRVPAKPSHEAAVQSADGAWWEFNGTELWLEHLGGIGNNAFNNATVFKDAVLAASALRIKLRLAANKTYRIAVSGSAGIAVSGLPYVDIQGCGDSSTLKFVGSVNAHALAFTECPGASVTDAHVDMIDCIQPAGSNKSSLIFISCNNAVAARNTISGFHWIGLCFDNCKDLLGEFNHIKRRTDLTGGALNALSHGINCSSSESPSTGSIRNNIVEDCGTIFVGYDMEISGNIVSRPHYGAGIATGGAVGAITGFGYRVLNNVCRYGTGVDVDGTYVGGMEIIGDRSLIYGNVCHNNSGCGIDNFSANSVIIGNECFNNGGGGGPISQAGISMRYAADAGYAANDCIVSGNRCYDTGGGTQKYGYAEYAGTAGALSGINLVGNAFKNNAIGETLVQSPLGSYYGSRLYHKESYASPPIPAGAMDYGCSLTFPGAALGDFVKVSLSVGAVGIQAYGHVSAVNAVQVVLHNPTIAEISLGVIDVRITVERPPT